MYRKLKNLSFLSLFCCLTLLFSGAAKAQMQNDIVTWKASLEDKGTAEKTLVFSAKIKSGWHIYDQNMPEDGPNSTEFKFYKLQGAKRVGALLLIVSLTRRMKSSLR